LIEMEPGVISEMVIRSVNSVPTDDNPNNNPQTVKQVVTRNVITTCPVIDIYRKQSIIVIVICQ